MYKIDFSYNRDVENSPVITYAWVTKDGKRIGKDGEAVRHDLDMGRKLALARAIHDLPLEERKIVWEEYFKR